MLTLWMIWLIEGGSTVAQDDVLIVYAADVGGNTDVYVMSADGSNPTRLTDHPASDSEPAWSPDRQQIAFISDRDGSPEVYLMNADGANQRRQTTDSAFAGNPSWSPDGQRIVYESYRGGTAQLFVIAVSGGTSQVLTDGSAEDVDPAWSPDGRQIAFASSRRGNFEIYLMDTNGSNVRQVSSNPSGDNRSPAWSPNGTRIAFVSTYGRDSEINMMNADGRDIRPIAVNGNLFSDVVTWSPDEQSVAYMVWTAQGDRYIQVSGVNDFATRRLASGAGWPSWASPQPIRAANQPPSSVSLDTSSASGLIGIVNTGRLNMRNGPGIDYDEVGRITNGDTVTLIGRDSIGWWIEIDAAVIGVRGWVNARYLLVNEDILALPITFSLPGENSPLSEADTAITATVNSDDGTLNVRSGPGPDYSLLSTLQDRDQIVLIGRNGSASWVQISGYDFGWVSSRYLEFDGNLMKLPVMTNGLNLGSADLVQSDSPDTTSNTSVNNTPTINEQTQAAYQAFERGYMIWLQNNDTIYVLFPDGTWQTFVDLFNDGLETDPSIVPPPGLFQPRRGFGLVWRQNAFVRDRLGWGLHLESGYSAQYTYSSATEETRISGPESQRFILYSSGRWTGG